MSSPSDPKSSEDSQLGQNPKSRLPLILLGVLVVVGGGVATYFLWPDPPERRLSEEKRREVYRNIDLAIAIMEGGDFTKGDEGIAGLAKAVQIFEDLKKEFPEELLPVQNLAVAEALQFEAGDKDRYNERFESTLAAINELLARDDGKRVAAMLGARFLTQYAENAPDQSQMDPDRRATLMQEWLKQIPDFEKDGFAQVALYQAAIPAIDEHFQAVADQALRRAHEALPDNLYVLKQLLNRQLRERDPAVVDVLVAARPKFKALSRTIELGQNYDEGGASGLRTLESIDNAIAAIREGNWGTSGSVSVLLNVMMPTEAFRRDAAMLERHPLDYVMFRFSDEFREANPVPSPVTDPQVTRFSKGAEERLAGVEAVRDIHFVDFDLDRNNDWVVLQDDGLSIINSSPEKKPIAKLAINGDFSSVFVADLDYDFLDAPRAIRQDSKDYFLADPDVVIYGEDGVILVENRMAEESEERSLVVTPQTYGLDKVRGVRSATTVDIDHDKDLDLILVSEAGFQIWLNRGNRDFLEATEWSILPDVADSQVGLFPVDWDRDTDLDVVVVCDNLGIGILENMRHGQVAWRRFEGPFPQKGTAAVTVLEADGNVSWDVATVGEQLEVTLTASPGARAPRPLSNSTIANATPKASHRWIGAYDINNDTAVDLVVFDQQSVRVCYGSGDGTFSSPKDSGLTGEDISDLLVADMNGDGWLDLMGIDKGIPVVRYNKPADGGHWLQLNAVGQKDNAGYAGHTGIGSLVEIMSDGRYQARVVQSPTTHFGLGEKGIADVVRIVWTNGVPQSVIEPEKNQILIEKMVLKGSCPYIYTWTENGYEFLTDCLWAAPIGLQAADGVVAPSRSWEYLRIPGDRMQIVDGQYRMLLTEELWEAAYFDSVRLIAVDHPKEVEIFSNEKVGPPSIANYQIHTVSQRRVPLSARDKHGRDVMDLVKDEDEQYFAGWDRRIRQGLTDEHYLELDLGDLTDSQRITLFLRGWIYPTDTSWNVSLSQNPELAAPRMPSIWVMDENDQWVESIGFMGFPGGKTKTITVDLSEAFRKAGDYRVRVVTSGEISWDAAFFTVDEPMVELREHDCPVTSAELRFGGFSARLPARPHAPEVYDYRSRSKVPRWPPMDGSFTRYGDVTDIVRDSDDRSAILGSGDELEVRFEASGAAGEAELPEGWTRDFILHCVGWDKDADLNTIHGQTVEPLPFRNMPQYPYQTSAEFPQGPAIDHYLRHDQVRAADRMSFWRHLPLKYGK